MSLHIENEEIAKMAAELAAIGDSPDAEREKQPSETRAQQIINAARRFRQTLPEGVHSSDHSWLYGEDGLRR